MNWERMRLTFDASLLAKLRSYDPASDKAVYPRYARVEDLRKLLEIDEAPEVPFSLNLIKLPASSPLV